MAPHIVLREAGHKFDLEKVDIPNKKTAGGDDFWKINPKGYVPALANARIVGIPAAVGASLLAIVEFGSIQT